MNTASLNILAAGATGIDLPGLAGWLPAASLAIALTSLILTAICHAQLAHMRRMQNPVQSTPARADDLNVARVLSQHVLLSPTLVRLIDERVGRVVGGRAVSAASTPRCEAPRPDHAAHEQAGASCATDRATVEAANSAYEALQSALASVSRNSAALEERLTIRWEEIAARAAGKLEPQALEQAVQQLNLEIARCGAGRADGGYLSIFHRRSANGEPNIVLEVPRESIALCLCP